MAYFRTFLTFAFLRLVLSQDCQSIMPLEVWPGNIDLVFYLDIHNNLDGNCKNIDAKYGMMRLEAFFYALDLLKVEMESNGDKAIGAHIFDTCKSPTKEVICSVGASESSVGIIGPEDSSAVHITSVIFSSFTPQTAVVTYGGARNFPSDSQEYSNLFHTAPGNSQMVDALTDIALHYNWTFVSVLHAANDMASGFSEFKAAASKKGICIKYAASLRVKNKDSFFSQVLAPLKEQKALQVVFLLLTDRMAAGFFRYIARHKNDFSHLNFIGSPLLGTKVGVLSGDNGVDVGVVTVEVESARDLIFENYYLSLRPENNKRNIYFLKFWENLFNCSLPDQNLTKTYSVERSRKRCTGDEAFSEGTGFYQDAPVEPIINAVLSFGAAIKLANGTENPPCEEENCTIPGYIYRESVLSHLNQIQFNSSLGNRLQFNAEKSLNLNYTVYNTQLRHKKVVFTKIGSWRKPPNWSVNERLLINESQVQWRLGKVPVSRCGYDCARGEIRVYDAGFVCCWTCLACVENSIVINNTCFRCPLWTVSSKDGRKCLQMTLQSLNKSSTFPALVITLVACLSFVLAVTLILFVRYFDSRIVRASHRELSLVGIVGLAIMFLSPILFLTDPSPVVCHLQQYVLGIGLSLCSVPLFLKSLVIYRVVRKAKHSVTVPKLSGKRSQSLICVGLVTIQILLSSLWLAGNRMSAKRYLSADKQQIIVHCSFDFLTLTISFLYPCILLAMATTFVIRTKSKRLPTFVHEGKQTVFISVFICLVLFLYLASFTSFSQEKASFAQEYSISFMLIFIGAVYFVCIFAPKLLTLMSLKRIASQQITELGFTKDLRQPDLANHVIKPSAKLDDQTAAADQNAYQRTPSGILITVTPRGSCSQKF